MEISTTENTALPEGLRKRIKSVILKVLKIPGTDIKKLNTDIRKDAGKLEAIIKIDLSDFRMDIHNFIHSHFIRADHINNETNTRDMHFAIPNEFKDDIDKLADLVNVGDTTNINANKQKIEELLDQIEAKI